MVAEVHLPFPHNMNLAETPQTNLENATHTQRQSTRQVTSLSPSLQNSSLYHRAADTANSVLLVKHLEVVLLLVNHAREH